MRHNTKFLFSFLKLNRDDPTAYHLREHSKQDLGQEEAAQIDFEKAKELESAQ